MVEVDVRQDDPFQPAGAGGLEPFEDVVDIDGRARVDNPFAAPALRWP
jgi:hypothetical protein